MAYTSVQALIAVWCEERGVSAGQGDQRDLAEKFSEMLTMAADFSLARALELADAGCPHEHRWSTIKDSPPFCVKCGVVKRATGKNKPCPGIVKVSLRKPERGTK